MQEGCVGKVRFLGCKTKGTEIKLQQKTLQQTVNFVTTGRKM